MDHIDGYFCMLKPTASVQQRGNELVYFENWATNFIVGLTPADSKVGLENEELQAN